MPSSEDIQTTLLDYLMTHSIEAKIRLPIDGGVKYYNAEKESFTSFQDATVYRGGKDWTLTTTFFDVAEIQQCISVWLNTEIELYNPETGIGIVRSFFPGDLEVDISSDPVIRKMIETLEKEGVVG